MPEIDEGRGAGIVDRDMVGVDGDGGVQVDRRVVAVDAHVALPGAAAAACRWPLPCRRGCLSMMWLPSSSRSAMPCSAIMSQSRVSPMPLQPIRAWMSPSTCTGSRTLARTMRITLSSILPSRIRGSSGRNRPSWKTCRPSGDWPQAADVDHMRGAGEQRHQLAAMEGGRGDDDVVEMAGALPRDRWSHRRRPASWSRPGTRG